jgi:PAS domain S-box-containing protein
MNVQNKTTQQLLGELADARQQIARLEARVQAARPVQLALRESEERFRIALQNSNLVVYNQDKDLRYTWIYNPLLGFTPEGILGKTDAELLVPEDAARLDEIKGQVLATAVGARETVRTIIDGTAYYYDISVEPLRDAAGDVIGVTGASRDITERVQAETTLQQRTHDLGERVKELNCLYGISHLVERPGISLEEILQGTVDLIPPSWQYPEVTGARAILDGKEFRTENFGVDATWQQAAKIIVHGQPCGSVEVCYLEERPAGDEGPFLKEERSLLNAIAERLGSITEHKNAEAEARQATLALQRAHDELELRVEERTAEIERGHRRERVLNALLRTSMADTSLEEQLERALDEVLSIPWLPVLSQGGIFLVGDSPGVLELQAHQGLSPALQASCASVDIGQCLCGRAAASGAIEFASHVDERHEICYEGMAPHGHYCIPILSGDRAIGAIVLYLAEGHQQAPQEEEFLEAVANTLAGMIERKRADDALRLYAQRLQALTARLAEVAESERQGLARELHDQVGQNLTALGLDLSIVRMQMPDGTPASIRARLDESLSLVEQTSERIRDVMASLRPPMLDDYGLVATLHWFGALFSRRTGIAVTVDGVEAVPRPAAPVENALFRIAQEALTNVAKHAQATQVTLRVAVDTETLRLVVADNGVGFHPAHRAELDGSRGWGLLTMAERAEAVGAHCQVASQLGQGTRVVVEVPR